MGASIPLPALDVKTPEQPDILANYTRLQQLRNLQQETALRQQLAPLQVQQAQQGIQAQGLQIQQEQMNMRSAQALMSSFANLDPSDPHYFEKGIQAAQKTGQVLPQQLQGIMNARLDFQNKTATLNKTQQEVLQNRSDALHSLGTQYLSQPDQDMAQNWPAVREKVIELHQGEPNFDPNSIPQQFPGRQWVQANTVVSGMSAAMMRATAQQQEAQTASDKLKASMNPQSSLYAPSAASVALGTAPGAAQIQAGEARLAAAKAGAEERARLPGEMALAAQRQALSQGDPNAAGQLLVNGDATLAELKARGATPDFIAKTLFAARQLSGGKYNAQEAEANFNVAKSQANTAFFGSAGSLVSKGGTLDQLQEAAKAIPQGQFPKLNSLADWEKAATGSGPIAKYASIALGVADDYAKVMGGGQGSDTSRAQALEKIAANQSPAQRAGSIEGIRGAVLSQATSRIGKNPIMQRMYGDQFQQPSTSAGIAVGSIITQNGHQYKVTAIDKNGKPTAADPVGQ